MALSCLTMFYQASRKGYFSERELSHITYKCLPFIQHKSLTIVYYVGWMRVMFICDYSLSLGLLLSKRWAHLSNYTKYWI